MAQGPMSEYPQFRTVSAPDTYPKETTAAVRFVPVQRQGRLLGYLWASVDDVAAGYLWRPDARPDSFNTGQEWVRRLRWAKANGLTPLQALRHWVGQPEDAGGHLPAGTEQEAPSLDALKSAAGR